MISEERKVFFRWLGAGLSTGSLALIVFVPDMAAGNPALRLWSIGFFFISITFAISMLFINQEIDIFSKPVNERIKGIHHTCLLISLVAFLLGFSLFALSIHWAVLVAFLVSALLGVKAWKVAQSQLANT